VRLTVDGNEVRLPQTVTIPEGHVQSTFPVSTFSVNSTLNRTISARVAGQTVTTRLTLVPAQQVAPTLLSLTLAPSWTHAGGTTVGTVMLSGPAPRGGVTVFLTSDNAAVPLPASVLVP
jgi:hypothetical protein